MISPLWFNTGEPHPLASESKLEVTVSSAAAHILPEDNQAMVIGDYILYWVAPIFSESEAQENTSLCSIYLVAWKDGWISEVCICPTFIPTKINFVPLASCLPSRRVWLGIICTIKGDNHANSTA